MIRVTATEFRKNLSRYLDCLDQGEIVDISRNGKPVGRLVPANTRDWRLNMTQKVILLAPEAEVFAPMDDLWVDLA